MNHMVVPSALAYFRWRRDPLASMLHPETMVDP